MRCCPCAMNTRHWAYPKITKSALACADWSGAARREPGLAVLRRRRKAPNRDRCSSEESTRRRAIVVAKAPRTPSRIVCGNARSRRIFAVPLGVGIGIFGLRTNERRGRSSFESSITTRINADAPTQCWWLLQRKTPVSQRETRHTDVIDVALLLCFRHGVLRFGVHAHGTSQSYNLDH